MKNIFSSKPFATDLAFLLLRVSFGFLLAIDHGWDKLKHFPDADFPSEFYLDAKVSMALCVFAEFFC